MRVFVSYRRSDSRQVAGRLRDHLADEFGEDNVFYDVDSVEYGVDFREVIRATLRQSDAVVVVIGPHFDVERLTDEHDYVRLELAEALAQKKRIVPVLVEDARMPSPQQLPGLEDLAYFNAAPVRADPDFRRDTARLIESLRRLAAGRVGPGDDPTVAMAGVARAPAAPTVEAPVPAPEPPAPTVEASAPAPPPVPAAPAEREVAPTGTDRRLRTAAWLVGIAALAFLVGRILPWFRYNDYSSHLGDFAGLAEGVFGLAVVAAWTAFALRGSGRPGTGVTMALALAPTAVLTGFGSAAYFAWVARDDSEFRSAGAGFVMIELASLLLLVAAALAATRARRHLSRPASVARSQAPEIAGAAVLGAAAAVIWAQELDDGQVWSNGHVTGLVIRLAILGLAGCAFSGWLRAHGVRGRTGVAVTLVVYAAIGLEFLMAENSWSAGDVLFRIAFFVLAVSATVVPVLAVLLHQRRLAATLFGTWALGALLADTDAGVTGNPLLPLALAAGAAYLVVRAVRAPDTGDAAVTAPDVPAALP